MQPGKLSVSGNKELISGNFIWEIYGYKANMYKEIPPMKCCVYNIQGYMLSGGSNVGTSL